ncbi:MAG: pyruvate formate-lyase-activating protein [Treponemataceae bacterium]
MKANIHSIETFGTVDGPGIRFVVFFQGCPMRCLYCHNPDTWETVENKLISCEEIIAKYINNYDFYKKGGITITGGEPLLQLDFVLDLFEKAASVELPKDFVCGKRGGIHCTLDTSGILFSADFSENEHSRISVKNKSLIEKYNKLCFFTDLVLLDIKHIDNEKHKKLTGHSNKNVLNFARFLSEKGVDMIIRYVLVPSLNDDIACLERTGDFISGLKTVKAVDILPYHTMGKVKYERLGIDYPLKEVPAATKEQVEIARSVILKRISSNLERRNFEAP